MPIFRNCDFSPFLKQQKLGGGGTEERSVCSQLAPAGRATGLVLPSSLLGKCGEQGRGLVGREGDPRGCPTEQHEV